MVVLLPPFVEELVVQLAITLHQDETAIARSIGLVVRQPLHALHTLALQRLVTVWPWAPL